MQTDRKWSEIDPILFFIFVSTLKKDFQSFGNEFQNTLSLVVVSPFIGQLDVKARCKYGSPFKASADTSISRCNLLSVQFYNYPKCNIPWVYVLTDHYSLWAYIRR